MSELEPRPTRWPLVAVVVIAAVSIMLFAGIQLISIGVVGEYLGRVFDEVKQRPNYVVAEIADFSPLSAVARDVPAAAR